MDVRREDERTEADLAMARYADGDRSAMDVIYRALAPRLYAFVLHRLHHAAQAEDVVADTFEKIVVAADRFIRGARVLPWAISIASNLIRDGHRHAECQARLDAYHALGYAAALLELETPEDTTERRRLLWEVNRLLRSLPPAQAEALCLVTVEGLSLEEAAEVLGKLANNVKQLVHRAREALKALLNARPKKP